MDWSFFQKKKNVVPSIDAVSRKQCSNVFIPLLLFLLQTPV